MRYPLYKKRIVEIIVTAMAHKGVGGVITYRSIRGSVEYGNAMTPTPLGKNDTNPLITTKEWSKWECHIFPKVVGNWR